MIKLPLITIQSDFSLDLQKNGTFWLSLYHFYNSTTSIHAKVTSIDKKLSNDSSLDLKYVNDDELELGVPYGIIRITSSKRQWNPINGKEITSLAISSSKLLYAIGSIEGDVIVNELNGTIGRILKGHLGYITTVKFFPSDKVLLSASMDMQIKIWDVYTGTCAMTLKGGHTSSILDLVIVGKGKNVISCGKDGKICMYLVGTGKIIKTLYEGTVSVNRMSIVGNVESGYKGGNDEYEVEDKLLYSVFEDGKLIQMDMGGRILKQVKRGESLNCVYATKEYVVVGSKNGIVGVYDDELELIVEFTRNDVIINDLWIEGKRVVVASGDGQLYEIEISGNGVERGETGHRGNGVERGETGHRGNGGERGENNGENGNVEIKREMIGSEMDSVRMVILGNNVFSASKDGKLREY